MQQYSVAVSASDRTYPLLAGTVTRLDLPLTFLHLSMDEIFRRQIESAAFDIAECTLGSYLIAIANGETRLTAIPVPLVRRFRQDQIYVAGTSTLRSLDELSGKRFGLPEFQATPAIWLRGLLREAGIGNHAVQWVTYRTERVATATPATRGTSRGVFEGLLSGEIDVGFAPMRPPAEHFPLDGRGGAIRRLLSDPWAADRACYDRTTRFPIGTIVTARREIARTSPAFPRQIYDMFLEAKTIALQSLMNLGQVAVMDAFLHESVEQSFSTLGSDPWPYGFKSCWADIEVFMEFMLEDGLINRKLSPAEVFHPALHDI